MNGTRPSPTAAEPSTRAPSLLVPGERSRLVAAYAGQAGVDMMLRPGFDPAADAWRCPTPVRSSVDGRPALLCSSESTTLTVAMPGGGVVRVSGPDAATAMARAESLEPISYEEWVLLGLPTRGHDVDVGYRPATTVP